MVVAAFAIFMGATSAFAQLSPLEPPLAGQPTNFSQLIGRFTIEATVEPTEALVEDPVTLRVVIKGVIAAGEPPSRKHLRIFADDFAASFYVEPILEQDKPNPEEKTWEFVWKLRPKATDVRELPSLALAYFSPQVRSYQMARSEPIALTIKARPIIEVEADELLSAPESFLELAAWSQPRSPWRAGSRMPSCGLFEFIVLAVILAVASWRRAGLRLKHAAAERIAQRNRLSADAVAALQQGPADPAMVVTRFLQARFGLVALEPSAADIHAALKRNGIGATVRERWTNWYRTVAALRFAPASFEAASKRRLADEAIALIRMVEKPS